MAASTFTKENLALPWEYIVPTPFKGTVKEIVVAGKLTWHSISIDDFMKEESGLRKLSEEEFSKEEAEFFVTKFKEISANEYQESLECLPPLRYKTLTDGLIMFFCSEALSGIFNGLYIRHSATNKFYNCIMSRYATEQEIVNKFKHEIVSTQNV